MYSKLRYKFLLCSNNIMPYFLLHYFEKHKVLAILFLSSENSVGHSSGLYTDVMYFFCTAD